MAVNKKNIMTRYFFVVLIMGLLGIAIVVKGAIIMFAERQYWHDVADRFVKENVTVKPNRGNILSSDGKLMASSLPEYRIYMDFKAGGYTMQAKGVPIDMILILQSVIVLLIAAPALVRWLFRLPDVRALAANTRKGNADEHK